MNSANSKSVIIEGDKNMFQTKGAIDRLKRDLRSNDEQKLKENTYFKNGWTYQVVSSSDAEIKVQITPNTGSNSTRQTSTLSEAETKRRMLKDRLKIMRDEKRSPELLRSTLKNKVPEDLIDSYIELKKLQSKVQLKVPVPSPVEVLSNQDEFRQLVHMTVQSFGMFNGANNPVVNYYRGLAHHMGLPTTFQPPQQQQVQQTPETNAFIEQLRKQRTDTVSTDVDDEMKKIYESLGIDVGTSSTSSQTETQSQPSGEVDDEMRKIYESLGVQVDKEMKTMDI